MRRNLQEMVTVITGASAGIGRALAVELSAHGGKLVLAARRLDRLEDLNRSLGGKHLCISTDVSRPEECARLISASVERFGRIDTLVCNAGYGFLRTFDEHTEAEVREIFNTNFFGTTECARLAVGAMKAQSLRDGFAGQVMIVSSACARRGLPFFSIYAATKAAQLSLAEGLRVELKPMRIAVTSVHPMLCESDFFETTSCLSGMSPAALSAGHKQTVQTVARRMVKAIVKPSRECWPHPFSRLGLTLAVALPGLSELVMGGMRDRFIRDNEKGRETRERNSSVKMPERQTTSTAAETSSVT